MSRAEATTAGRRPPSSAVRYLLPLLLAACVVLVTLGVLHERAASSSWLSSELLDLDQEGTAAAAWSGILLLLAALMSVKLGTQWWWRAMAVVFVFMALDEVFAMHEHVEELVGVFWQVVYLPVILAAGLAWTVIILRLDRPSARALWLTGAAGWGVSQVLEYLQWHQLESIQTSLMIVEEGLEILGTSALLAALVVEYGGSMRRATRTG